MKFHLKRGYVIIRVNIVSEKMGCSDGDFLLAETEVLVTLISSHVKDKNLIFTANEIFFTGKILVFHRYLALRIVNWFGIPNFRTINPSFPLIEQKYAPF